MRIFRRDPPSRWWRREPPIRRLRGPRLGVGGLLGGGIEKDPQPMTAFLVEMLSE
jgi:hypothetical protein